MIIKTYLNLIDDMKKKKKEKKNHHAILSTFFLLQINNLDVNTRFILWSLTEKSLSFTHAH